MHFCTQASNVLFCNYELKKKSNLYTAFEFNVNIFFHLWEIFQLFKYQFSIITDFIVMKCISIKFLFIFRNNLQRKKKSFFVSAIYWFLKHFYYRTFISFKEEYSWNDYFFIRNKFNLTQQFSNHIIHNILLASRVFRKNLYSSECHGKKDGLFLSLDDKKKSELWFQIVTIIFEWKHFKTKDIFIIRFVSS